MPFCSPGQQATIKYTFNRGKERIHTLLNTPIEIELTEKYIPDFIGGQCPTFYDVYYEVTYGGSFSCIPETSRGTKLLLGPIESIGWEFKLDGGYDPFSPLITFTNSANFCIYHANKQRTVIGGASGGICQNPANWSVRILSVVRRDGLGDNCGSSKKICQMAVKRNGVNLFIDQGECPCEVDVMCGHCPDGYVEGRADEYPGYCCIPCSELKPDLKYLTYEVWRINNG